MKLVVSLLALICVGSSYAQPPTHEDVANLSALRERHGVPSTYSRTNLVDAYYKYFNARVGIEDDGDLLSSTELKILIRNLSEVPDDRLTALIEGGTYPAKDLLQFSNIYKWLRSPRPEGLYLEPEIALTIVLNAFEPYYSGRKDNNDRKYALPATLIKDKFDEIKKAWKLWSHLRDLVPKVKTGSFYGVLPNEEVNEGRLPDLLKAASPEAAVFDYFDELMQARVLGGVGNEKGEQIPRGGYKTYGERKTAAARLYDESFKKIHSSGGKSWREIFIPTDHEFLDCVKRFDMWFAKQGFPEMQWNEIRGRHLSGLRPCAQEITFNGKITWSPNAEEEVNRKIAHQLLNDHNGLEMGKAFVSISKQIEFNSFLFNMLQSCSSHDPKDPMKCIMEAPGLLEEVRKALYSTTKYQQGLSGFQVPFMKEQQDFFVSQLEKQIKGLDAANLFLMELTGDNGHPLGSQPQYSNKLRSDLTFKYQSPNAFPKMHFADSQHLAPVDVKTLTDETRQILEDFSKNLKDHQRSIEETSTSFWNKNKPRLLEVQKETNALADKTANEFLTLSRQHLEKGHSITLPVSERSAHEPNSREAAISKILIGGKLTPFQLAHVMKSLPQKNLTQILEIYAAVNGLKLPKGIRTFPKGEGIRIASLMEMNLEKQYPEGIPPAAAKRAIGDLILANVIWTDAMKVGFGYDGRHELLKSTDPKLFIKHVNQSIRNGEAIAPSLVEAMNEEIEPTYFNTIMGVINGRPRGGGPSRRLNGVETEVTPYVTHWNNHDLMLENKVDKSFLIQFDHWKPIYDLYRSRPWATYIPSDSELDQLPNSKRNPKPHNLQFRHGQTLYNDDVQRALREYNSALHAGAEQEAVARNVFLGIFESVHVAEGLQALFENAAKTADENSALFVKIAHCSDSPSDYLSCLDILSENEIANCLVKTEKLARQMAFAGNSPPFQKAYNVYEPLLNDQLATLRAAESWLARQRHPDIAHHVSSVNKPLAERTAGEIAMEVFSSPFHSKMERSANVATSIPPDGSKNQLVAFMDGGTPTQSGTTLKASANGAGAGANPSPALPGFGPRIEPGSGRAQGEALRVQLHSQMPARIEKAQGETNTYLSNIQNGWATKIDAISAEIEKAKHNALLVRQMATPVGSADYQKIAERFPNLSEEAKQEFAKDLEQSAAFMKFLEKNPQLVREFQKGNFLPKDGSHDEFLTNIQKDANELKHAGEYLEKLRQDPGTAVLLNALGPIEQDIKKMQTIAALGHLSGSSVEAGALLSVQHELIKMLGSETNKSTADIAVGLGPLGFAQAGCEAITGASCTFATPGRSLSKGEYVSSILVAGLGLGLGKGAIQTIKQGSKLFRGEKGLAKIAEGAESVSHAESALANAIKAVPEIKSLAPEASALLGHNLSLMPADDARKLIQLGKDKILTPNQLTVYSQFESAVLARPGDSFFSTQLKDLSNTLKQIDIEHATAGRSLDLVPGLRAEYRNAELMKAGLDDLTRPYFSSWTESGAVGIGKTNSPVKLYRVHEVEGRSGAWMLVTDPKGISKAVLADKLALPKGVDGIKFISEIELPTGTRLMIGGAGPNAKGAGGALQIQVLDKVDKLNIKTMPFE